MPGVFLCLRFIPLCQNGGMTRNTVLSPIDTPPAFELTLSLRLAGLDLVVSVHTTAQALVGIEFNPQRPSGGSSSTPRGRVAEDAGRQLQRYAEDPEWRFSLPLQTRGTPFQQRLWDALRGIPPGRHQTYGQLARALNSAPRAVGQACRRNPVPIVVPCHRVLAAGGVGGFAGASAGEKLDIKRALLAHEGWEG